MIQDIPPVPPVPPIPDFPAPGPTPDEVFGFLIPLAGMMTGIIITGMFILGPIGKAIGAAIRHWLGGGEKLEPGPEIDALRDEVAQLRGQLAEMAERQDFTERLLAQAKRDRALPGGTDVAG